jgi:hypothetical protein
MHPDSCSSSLEACRDCKLAVDKQLDAAWLALTQTAATWDVYDAKRALLSLARQQREQAHHHVAAQARMQEQNVPVAFVLKGGQLELPRGQALPSLGDAALVHVATVRALNGAVVDAANKALDILRDCNALRRQAVHAEWEIARDTLAAKHKQEGVQELQLLHIGREVSQLWDGGVVAKGTPAEKQAELLLTHGKLMHVRAGGLTQHMAVGHSLEQRDQLDGAEFGMHALLIDTHHMVLGSWSNTRAGLIKVWQHAGGAGAHQVALFRSHHRQSGRRHRGE